MHVVRAEPMRTRGRITTLISCFGYFYPAACHPLLNCYGAMQEQHFPDLGQTQSQTLRIVVLESGTRAAPPAHTAFSEIQTTPS